MLRTLKRIFAAESAAAVIALVSVFVIFSLVNERFLTGLNIHGIIVSAAISAITGLGMTLIISMRALDLSVGSIMRFSAIVAAVLLEQGVPLWLVIVIGVIRRPTTISTRSLRWWSAAPACSAARARSSARCSPRGCSPW
jgi:ribose/xylose/arabinose/galactoside ABC-type transport system permease subunit